MNEPGRRPPTNRCSVADGQDIPPAAAEVLDLARRLLDLLATDDTEGGRALVVDADLPRPTLVPEHRLRWTLPSGDFHLIPVDSEADAEAKAEQLRAGGSGKSTATVESRFVTPWKPSIAAHGVDAEAVRS